MKSHYSSRTGLAFTVALCPMSFGMASTSYAQNAPATAQTAVEGSQDGGLAEIIVTAQKRAENLQKVPATVTALGSEALETRQINNISGLQSVIPSLFVGKFFGSSLISLRGISSGITSGAEDPTVATHINGVYQPRSRTIDIAMADIDRVEVLAGPQGTLYGRNATGGVINYVLKRPTDSFQGEVTGSIGNYESYGIKGRVSGPLTEGVNLLVSGIYDSQDKGYVTNLLPNAPLSRVDTRRTVGGRAALDVKFPKGGSLQLDVIYSESKGSPSPSAFGPPIAPIFVTYLGQQTFNPREVYSEQLSFQKTNYFQAMGTLALPITDDIELKSITGYQKFKDVGSYDLDASPVTAAPISTFLESDSFTQEFNISATSFDGRLKSIFGVFYYHDNFLGTADSAFNVPGFNANFATYTKLKSESFAAFTDQTFSVTDKLRLQAGLRYNYDRKTNVQTITIAGTTICPLLTDKLNWDSLTPRVGVQYDITDNIMGYAQYSKGFKSGGVAVHSCHNAFNPERIDAYEAGIKTTLFENHVRFNLSGFQYRISNLQVQKAAGVGEFTVQNAAAAKIYGLEFSLNALLAPNLQLDAAGIIQSAKYQNFQNCDELAFLGACSSFDTRPVDSRQTDASGNWLNRAPPYTLNVGLQYEIEFANAGKILFRGETFFSGKVRFREFESTAFVQEAYNIQNFFVTYNAPDDRFALRGFVKNIGNEAYKVSAFYQSAVTLPTGNWSPPRTFGAEATVRF